ncbi:hypothetical protein ECFDA505_2175, partial [Escherichia coli FDA505]
MVFLFTI